MYGCVVNKQIDIIENKYIIEKLRPSCILVNNWVLFTKGTIGNGEKYFFNTIFLQTYIAYSK